MNMEAFVRSPAVLLAASADPWPAKRRTLVDFRAKLVARPASDRELPIDGLVLKEPYYYDESDPALIRNQDGDVVYQLPQVFANRVLYFPLEEIEAVETAWDYAATRFTSSRTSFPPSRRVPLSQVIAEIDGLISQADRVVAGPIRADAEIISVDFPESGSSLLGWGIGVAVAGGALTLIGVAALIALAQRR